MLHSKTGVFKCNIHNNGKYVSNCLCQGQYRDADLGKSGV